MVVGALVLVGAQTSARSAFAEEGFYVGLNGGVNWLKGGDGDTETAGGNHNGSLYDIEGDHGSLLGGVAGYKFSDLWRADISYTRLNNKLDWKGVFPGGGLHSAFTSDASSDVVMLNGYLHAKGFDEDTFATFDPFIGAGIGFTSNRLTNIVESNASTGSFEADVHDGKKIYPAFRLGVGLDANIAPSLTLTSSLDAYWLGGFETGDGRDRAASGFQEIGAWQIDDVVSVGISVGLRYAF
ncbi:hypothetical protein GCM10009100_40490 [Thalassospira tepidiphila]